jgi:hypothetical protein
MPNIVGYQNTVIKNELTTNGSSSHLGVLLPGRAYTVNHPALLDANSALSSLGADVLTIEPSYTLESFQALPESEKLECVNVEARAILQSVLALHRYERVTWVAKSLGTLLIGSMLERMPSHHELIGLTPLLRVERLRHALLNNPRRRLMVIGSSDPQFDPEFLALLERKGQCESLVLEGVNHGLEVEGDDVASTRVQDYIVRALLEFLQKRQPQQDKTSGTS